jgi:hypothetical protein
VLRTELLASLDLLDLLHRWHGGSSVIGGSGPPCTGALAARCPATGRKLQ